MVGEGCESCVFQDMFIKAVIDTVAANKAYVPPLDKGAMYIRPLLIGASCLLFIRQDFRTRTLEGSSCVEPPKYLACRFHD